MYRNSDDVIRLTKFLCISISLSSTFSDKKTLEKGRIEKNSFIRVDTVLLSIWKAQKNHPIESNFVWYVPINARARAQEVHMEKR